MNKVAEFYTVITTAGREAVARATQAGVKVDITHMAIGDGGGVPVTPSENQTQLVNECWRGLVATYSQQGSKLIIDTYIPPDEASFITREMGLFTADGVLFAVCKTPEMRKVLPSEGAIDSFVFGMELDITDVDMRYIEIHTNPIFNFDPAGSAEAVQQNLDIHIANKQNPHNTTAAHVGAIPTAQKGAVNGVATLDSNKQLTSTQIPSSITKHIASRQNPHGVTAEQVGTYDKNEIVNLINNNISTSVVSGTYIGTSGTKYINLGFTPKAVLVFNKYGQTRDYNISADTTYDGGLAVTDNDVVKASYDSDSDAYIDYSLLSITTNGFNIHAIKASTNGYIGYIGPNISGTKYHYVAFK